MQVIAHEGSQELADILDQSSILDITDHHGLRMYTIECNGQDVLMFADGSNNAFTVYPSASFDAEFGGSIHDTARAIRDAEPA